MTNHNPKHPGILELVSQGDFAAAATVLRMVDSEGLKAEQIAYVFAATAEGTRIARASGDIRAVIFEYLLKTSAFKMDPGDVVAFKWEFGKAHRNPDITRVERLESLEIGAAALMDEHRLKTDDLIELAEAVADGLEATRNRARIALMQDNIAVQLGKKLPNVHQRVYESVFELAARPSSSADCIFNIILTAQASRAEKGEISLEPTVMRRLNRMLPQRQAKPVQGALSDGDAKLPNPMARTKQVPAPHMAAAARKPLRSGANAQ
jgi:hypothetical protein